MQQMLKLYVAKKIAKEYGLNETEVKKFLDKKQRGRPKHDKRVISSIQEGEDLIGRLISEAKREKEIESDQEEEIIVKRFVYKQVTYLKSQDNKIYSNESHEEIGRWIELKQEIEFI